MHLDVTCGMIGSSQYLERGTLYETTTGLVPQFTCEAPATQTSGKVRMPATTDRLAGGSKSLDYDVHVWMTMRASNGIA